MDQCFIHEHSPLAIWYFIKTLEIQCRQWLGYTMEGDYSQCNFERVHSYIQTWLFHFLLHLSFLLISMNYQDLSNIGSFIWIQIWMCKYSQTCYSTFYWIELPITICELLKHMLGKIIYTYVNQNYSSTFLLHPRSLHVK